MADRWPVGAVSDMAELLDGAQDDLGNLAALLTDGASNSMADIDSPGLCHLRQARARLTAARAYLLFLDGDADR